MEILKEDLKEIVMEELLVEISKGSLMAISIGVKSEASSFIHILE